MVRKKAEETTLRALAKPDGPDPWQQIEAATARERTLYLPYSFIEGAAGFNTILFRYARLLLRGAEERPKPNTERLHEFTDTNLSRIEQQLSGTSIYAEVETLTLSFSFQRMREWLGPDYPLVRRLLAKESPEALATRLVAETQLTIRRYANACGKVERSSLDASRDPMIEFARSLDAESRAFAGSSRTRSRRRSRPHRHALRRSASEPMEPACIRTPPSRFA